MLAGKECVPTSDEDVMADLMENHQEFIHAMKSRLTKLEVIKRIEIRSSVLFTAVRHYYVTYIG